MPPDYLLESSRLAAIPLPVPPADNPVPPTVSPVPPTDTPVPTDTPSSTHTPLPTVTPVPPTPADTPAPTVAPTESASPTPSPTATSKPKPKAGKILLTSNRVSWDDVFVMNDDGTDMQQLTTMGKCRDAHFTPDGATILFEHDDDIRKMNADGSGQANLSTTADNLEAFPVVAPYGTRVAHLFAWREGFEIYSMKIDGTDPKPLTSGDIDWMPGWSPTAEKIASRRYKAAALTSGW